MIMIIKASTVLDPTVLYYSGKMSSAAQYSVRPTEDLFYVTREVTQNNVGDGDNGKNDENGGIGSIDDSDDSDYSDNGQ